MVTRPPPRLAPAASPLATPCRSTTSMPTSSRCEPWAAPNALVAYSDYIQVHSLSGILIDGGPDSYTYAWNPNSLPTQDTGPYREIIHGDYKHAHLIFNAWWDY